MTDWAIAGAEDSLAKIHELTAGAMRPSPGTGALRPEPERIVPSASPLSVAIDGPGLFIFEDGKRQLYGRLGAFRLGADGRLTDAEGRGVLGFHATAQASGATRLTPITVPVEAFTVHRYARYSIDENGFFIGHTTQLDAPSNARSDKAEPIARIALAIFPAPERLAAAGETCYAQTSGAGPPAFYLPGDVNVGRLLTHSLEAGPEGLKKSLEQIWLLRRRAALQTAMVAVKDQCTRTALGLVK